MVRAGVRAATRLKPAPEDEPMSFLRILLWILIAVAMLIFAVANWNDVTLNLWGGLALTIKLPFLMLLNVLATWLPTWLVMRGKLWRQQRRFAVESQSRPVPAPPPAPDATQSRDPNAGEFS
jgi:uncharacterized integral membrane protein